MNCYEKILVTGGTGFVGANVLKRLIKENKQPVALVRELPQTKITGVEYIKYEGLTVKVDWKPFLDQVHTIIHCAARVHILNEAEKDPLSVFRLINVDATLALANAAEQAGVKRFIFISSIGVLGAETFNAPFNAESKESPYTPYTQSKYEAELALRNLESRSNLEVVILRPPLIYGAGAPGNFARLMQFVKSGIPLPFFTSSNKRSFIAIDNLVDFIYLCISHEKAPEKTLLVCDNSAISTGQLIRALAIALEKPPRLWWFPPKILRLLLEKIGKPGMAQQLFGSLEMDASSSFERLSWTPPFSMAQALRQMASLMQTSKKI